MFTVFKKIGEHYRAYRRHYFGEWKANAGSAVIEDAEMTPTFKQWARLASQIFGGLDILAVDVLYSEKQNKFYIIEVNDSMFGVADQYADEDNAHLREVVLYRMNQVYQ